MGLKLFDPRRILKYKEYLHKQLHYLNVFEKCKDLLELSQAKQWNQPQTDEYEKLDIIITLLFAKQSCSKNTKHYEWSPQLIKAVETLRFWRLLLKYSEWVTNKILLY
jgi:hypothetical protein